MLVLVGSLQLTRIWWSWLFVSGSVFIVNSKRRVDAPYTSYPSVDYHVLTCSRKLLQSTADGTAGRLSDIALQALYWKSGDSSMRCLQTGAQGTCHGVFAYIWADAAIASARQCPASLQ